MLSSVSSFFVVVDFVVLEAVFVELEAGFAVDVELEGLVLAVELELAVEAELVGAGLGPLEVEVLLLVVGAGLGLLEVEPPVVALDDDDWGLALEVDPALDAEDDEELPVDPDGLLLLSVVAVDVEVDPD